MLKEQEKQWRLLVEDSHENGGFVETTDSGQHIALHLARGEAEGGTLLVTFETSQNIAAHPSQKPWAFDLPQEDLSLLCLVSDGQTLWRDSGLYALFDVLTDEGFFDDFDHVIFAGTELCAHAAASFSVAAPGATLLLIDPVLKDAPWENRAHKLRHTDLGPRYASGADMLDAADAVYVVFDPYSAVQNMQCSALQGDHVKKLPLPFTGEALWPLMQSTGLHRNILHLLFNDDLTPQSALRVWRANRKSAGYVSVLLQRLYSAQKNACAEKLLAKLMR